MIPDGRADNTKISLDDALMSALAMFQLKNSSLLAFDKRRCEEPENLHTVFGITTIPCDSQKLNNGQTLYYQQICAASFVCPECKVVIPTFPENDYSTRRIHKKRL